METTKLKKFAQYARRSLREQVDVKMSNVLAEGSAARREKPKAVAELEAAVQTGGRERVIERVAYIWFNRFCALRFMDVNRYTRIGVVSPAEGQFQPEILAEAKMGHIDEEMVHDKVRQQIFALLDGKAPSRDPQGEAYRLLVVAACNFWNKAMPFLFQRIDDYTELLMPDDLLSDNSILARTREAMTPDACQDVEVIGWLYQFYISEKKDEVFGGLKNKKITPENIPAATQLFTPHWIVRYLVENSLGRLWLLNRPGSKLVERMDYYIKPEQAETDFLRISKPEEIKVCDPACGSGHMLTYAFDLLYAIYEEEGYAPTEIPEKILTHNLYGIEIDERAGELAAFALTMKACARQRRFFRKAIRPNICVLKNIHFEREQLSDYMDFAGRDLFTLPLRELLRQFEEADNFGSLIRPAVTDVAEMLQTLETKDLSGQLFLHETHEKVLQALQQADYLSPKYHVVIANPPYMGSKWMNGRLDSFMKKEYANFKQDIFSGFVIRCSILGIKAGYIGIMCPNVWMYISSYEELRKTILGKFYLQNLVELPLTGFKGATVQICAYTFKTINDESGASYFIKLTSFKGGDDEMASYAREAQKNPSCGWFYEAHHNEFLRIPGASIAYWIPKTAFDVLNKAESLDAFADPRKGMCTRDNDYFVRAWYEPSFHKIGFGQQSRKDAKASHKKWFPYQKGGDFRKWYGSHSNLVDWENDGYKLLNMESLGWKGNSTNHNLKYIFKPAIVWSKITSAIPSYRFSPEGFLFDDASGLCSVHNTQHIESILAYLCSIIGRYYMSVINPTLNIQPGNIAAMPFIEPRKIIDVKRAINISRSDWDSFETSWDFTRLPLLNPDYRQPTLKATYQKLRAHWREVTLEMQQLEEENNRIFIDAYGLQDELTPDVPFTEITLTCNPHYRYGNDKREEELEALLLADTMRELVSYAVGCMFGRYSLDKPGLILANQGETIEDYRKLVPEPSFPADDDNVIPMLDGDWFTDDIAERFKQFLKVAFGAEHYEENLRFVEQSLNVKGKRNYSIRDYFLGEFYADHVKRYKKRPIYWLFSSPKGNFNALIYMHRYRPDTVSVVLNDYLREFRTKLTSHKSHLEAVSNSASSSQSEKTKALKAIEKIVKMLAEMEEYEREVLYPLATRRVEIDLDDGVKANYPKFGAALKKIVGLDAQED